MNDDDLKARVISALREHSAELRRYVCARAHEADIDDILQIAAMRAIEKADGLRDADRILPWLYRIHHSAAMDAGRKSASDKRLKEAVASETDEPIETEAAPSCACSITQARQLSDNYASILSLVDIGGETLANAAKQLGISVNNATVRLHRARSALKQQMQDHCGVTSLAECHDCRCSYEGCC